MGEILGSLLVWHLDLLARNKNLVLPEGLHLPIRATRELRQCGIFEALKHVAMCALESTPDILVHFPTIALVDSEGGVSNRNLIWGEVFQDLGLCQLVENTWTCNLSRLKALAVWILQQSDAQSLDSRPGVVVQLDASMRDLLQEFVSKPLVPNDDPCAILNTIVSALRVSTGFLRPEEAIFGFANHLFWMTVGRGRENHWAEPYDWISFETLPRGGTFEKHVRSPKYKVQGVVFLTMRSSLIEPLSRISMSSRLSAIRTVVLAVA